MSNPVPVALGLPSEEIERIARYRYGRFYQEDGDEPVDVGEGEIVREGAPA